MGWGCKAAVKPGFRDRVEFVYLASRYTPLSWTSEGLRDAFRREDVSFLRDLEVLRLILFPWLAPWALVRSPLRGWGARRAEPNEQDQNKRDQTGKIMAKKTTQATRAKVTAATRAACRARGRHAIHRRMSHGQVETLRC